MDTQQRLDTPVFTDRPNPGRIRRKDSASLAGMVLQGAMRLIYEHGWTQGRMGNDDAGYCLLGACWEMSKRMIPEKYRAAEPGSMDWVRATPYNLSLHRAQQRVFKYLNLVREPGASTPMMLSQWNDDPERTVDEVLDALLATGY